MREEAREAGVEIVPRALAGHSAGQYAAAVAADAIDYADALRLVRERGRIMQERGIAGGMGAVVGLSDEQVARDRRCRARARRDQRGERQRARPDRPVGGHPRPRLRARDEQDGRRPQGCPPDRQRGQPLPAHAPRPRRVRPHPDQGPVPRPEGADARQRARHGDQHRRRPAHRAAPSTSSTGSSGRPPSVAWSATASPTSWRSGPGRVLSGLIRRISPEADTHQVDAPGRQGVAGNPGRVAGVSERRAVVTGLRHRLPGRHRRRCVLGRARRPGAPASARSRLFDASGFDVDVAGEVKGFEATQLHGRQGRAPARPQHAPRRGGDRRGAEATPGCSATTGASRADVDADRFGMVFGTGIGGIGILLDNHVTISSAVTAASRHSSSRTCSRTRRPARSPSSTACAATTWRSCHACATGGHAIGEAMEAIVRGQADIMLGAGTEAPLVPLAIAGFGQMRALGTPRDPDTGEYSPPMASRPFDATRDGFVVSEGSAVLVLEELAARAGARGAPDRRGHRLRLVGRRVRHGRAGGAGRGRPARDARRAGPRRHRSGRGRLHQPARDLDADQRPIRDDGHPRRSSASTPTSWPCRARSR